MVKNSGTVESAVGLQTWFNFTQHARDDWDLLWASGILFSKHNLGAGVRYYCIAIKYHKTKLFNILIEN